MSDYTFWQNALAGNFGQMHDGDAQPGFWRKRTSRAGPFVPVAIWEQSGALVALVDGKEADPAELWSYICRYPVTEAAYHQRVETGKWPDEDEAVSDSLVHDISTNNPPTDPAEILQGQIDAALKGVDDYAEVSDDPTASKAQSLRSRLLELSRDADKKREELKKPHFEAGKVVDATFQPLVKAAKAGADAIAKALSAHETRKAHEAEKIRKAAEDARIKAEREAVKARAEAELAGKPVAEIAPVAPAPEPMPAPITKIAGAYGRAASVKVVKVAKVIDQDAAYGFLRTHKELIELIATLAQRAVNAGYAVPGTEVTEERKVA